MFKFKRRHLLKASLTAGVAAATHSGFAKGVENVDDSNTALSSSQSSNRAISELKEIPDRALAALLIECCELSLHLQNHTIESARSIQPSKLFSPSDRYTSTVFSSPSSAHPLQFHGVVLRDSERSALIGSNGGMTLTSSRHNIMVLQTVPREAKALKSDSNLVLLDPDQPRQGYVCDRLKQLHASLKPQILAAVQQFDPTLPCYITGYSVAGAIAPLAALEVAQAFPLLRPQIQVYTYGTPALGDPVFAQFYNSLLPQTYSIINLADLIPALFPTYTAPGTAWTYLNQRGAVELNHAIETYKLALS